MESIRNNLLDQLAKTQIARREGILYVAIDAHLGAGKWELLAIASRLSVAVLPGGVEVFQLDGNAIAELHPPEFSSDGSVMKTTQRYRLIPPPCAGSGEGK